MSQDNAIRFPRIYETGCGDWTVDRKKILEKDPDKNIKSAMERHGTKEKKFQCRMFFSIFPKLDGQLILSQ